MDYSKPDGKCPFQECLIDKKEAELAALKGLVRETVHGILVALNGPDSNRVHKVRDILNRPEVRAIMEEG